MKSYLSFPYILIVWHDNKRKKKKKKKDLSYMSVFNIFKGIFVCDYYKNQP